MEQMMLQSSGLIGLELPNLPRAIPNPPRSWTSLVSKFSRRQVSFKNRRINHIQYEQNNQVFHRDFEIVLQKTSKYSKTM